MTEIFLTPPRPRRTPNPGRLGGLACAAKMSSEQRTHRATVAGNTVLRRYGLGYYQALGQASKRMADSLTA